MTRGQRFAKKVVIVTGAAQGIGRGVARASGTRYRFSCLPRAVWRRLAQKYLQQVVQETLAFERWPQAQVVAFEQSARFGCLQGFAQRL